MTFNHDLLESLNPKSYKWDCEVLKGMIRQKWCPAQLSMRFGFMYITVYDSNASVQTVIPIGNVKTIVLKEDHMKLEYALPRKANSKKLKMYKVFVRSKDNSTIQRTIYQEMQTTTDNIMEDYVPLCSALKLATVLYNQCENHAAYRLGEALHVLFVKRLSNAMESLVIKCMLEQQTTRKNREQHRPHIQTPQQPAPLANSIVLTKPNRRSRRLALHAISLSLSTLETKLIATMAEAFLSLRDHMILHPTSTSNQSLSAVETIASSEVNPYTNVSSVELLHSNSYNGWIDLFTEAIRTSFTNHLKLNSIHLECLFKRHRTSLLKYAFHGLRRYRIEDLTHRLLNDIVVARQESLKSNLLLISESMKYFFKSIKTREYLLMTLLRKNSDNAKEMFINALLARRDCMIQESATACLILQTFIKNRIYKLKYRGFIKLIELPETPENHSKRETAASRDRHGAKLCRLYTVAMAFSLLESRLQLLKGYALQLLLIKRVN